MLRDCAEDTQAPRDLAMPHDTRPPSTKSLVPLTKAPYLSMLQDLHPNSSCWGPASEESVFHRLAVFSVEVVWDTAFA